MKPGDLVSAFSYRIGVNYEPGGNRTVRKFGIVHRVGVRVADVFWCDGKFDIVSVVDTRLELEP